MTVSPLGAALNLDALQLAAALGVIACLLTLTALLALTLGERTRTRTRTRASRGGEAGR